MNLDDITITTNRTYDSNDNEISRDDRCRIYLALEIRITDSERKVNHDVLMTEFRKYAEEVINSIKAII